MKGEPMKKTKSINIKYVIEQEMYHNEQWYKIHSCNNLDVALKTFKRYVHNLENSAGPFIKEMLGRMRLRKITVISEVINKF
jgi:hypothetical protein